MRNSVLIVLAVFILVGCTDNARTRSFGGTMTMELKSGQKLVTATWKEQALW